MGDLCKSGVWISLCACVRVSVCVCVRVCCVSGGTHTHRAETQTQTFRSDGTHTLCGDPDTDTHMYGRAHAHLWVRGRHSFPYSTAAPPLWGPPSRAQAVRRSATSAAARLQAAGAARWFAFEHLAYR